MFIVSNVLFNMLDRNIVLYCLKKYSMAISESECELSQAWIDYWQRLKSNNSHKYAQTAHFFLNQISKQNMNNPEIWMRQYLIYLDEIAEGVSLQMLGNLIYLPEKLLSSFWQQQWNKHGWETIKSYGSVLFAATKS